MELIKLLPEYYDENVTMQTLQSILSKETDDLETGLSDTISECFASTASVLLSRYENLLGLTIDVTKKMITDEKESVQSLLEREPQRRK